ncbi:MAG: hypothetical protein DWQ08_07870 [Proteobacteria bacterium]|nr:MAG: hypothetical protein DWQ08_07870 [Pseudomonadota bacterium]
MAVIEEENPSGRQLARMQNTTCQERSLADGEALSPAVGTRRVAWARQELICWFDQTRAGIGRVDR